MKWHGTFRERCIRSGKDDSYDTKWGRFTPEQLINVDQSPPPFAMNVRRTYHHFDGEDQLTAVPRIHAPTQCPFFNYVMPSGRSTTPKHKMPLTSTAVCMLEVLFKLLA